jgi:hypothetical protein
MAMSRFDSDLSAASQMPGGAANALVAGNPGLGPLAKRLMMDPDIDEKEALSLIELPAQTIYLIDKVVRQKSRMGPIGIDNSEVINLEVETNFKKKNNHVLKLNNVDSNQEIEEERGYIDDYGIYHGVDQDEKLFKENERLLQRLTNVVTKQAGTVSLKNADMTISGSNNNYNDMTAHTDHNIVNISAQSNPRGAT